MKTLQERVHSAPKPDGWKLDKLHRVLRVRQGFKNVGMVEDNLLSLSYGRIKRKDIDGAGGLLPESFETYQIVEPGNIVMRLTDLQNDKRSIRQGLVTERGIITSAYDALEATKGNEARFWAYALLALDLAKYYYSLGGGVRQSIKFSDFPNDWVYLPDLGTQKQIADFLDAETARIDALIEKKLELRRAAERLRASSIDRAITGEDYDGSRTDTGNTWFPTIPSGWRLARLKHLVNSISDGPHISPEYVDSGIPFISARNIKVDRWSLDDAKFISEELFTELSRKSRPKKGDVLYTKGGTTGIARYVDLDFDFQIWVHVALLKVRRTVANAQFLATALNSLGCYEQSQLFTRGATNNDLGLNRMANIWVPLPPYEEQVKIVERLSQTFEKIDRLRSRLEHSVVRLREYRAALITAAVTGQIDVVVHARPAESVPRRAVADVVPLHTSPQPMSPPDRRTLRVLVAADVVHRLGADPYLGRTKLQKLMFLAEAHTNINGIGGRYQRYRYGPYDDAMVQEIEQGLRQDGYYDTREGAGADREKVAFQQMSRAGGHRDALAAALGGKTDSLRQLIDLFKGKDTEATEAVATLYAVWNDALIDGKQPDDAIIIRGFLQDWHPEKGKFKSTNLQTWLGWMRRNGLVPNGTGPRTVATNTPSLFDGE